MPRPKMRPSFRIDVRSSRGRVEDIIETRLAAGRDDIEGTLKTKHCVLEITGPGRRFWTPSLDLMFDDTPSDAASGPEPGTRVWGTFSPRAEIWTSFVFAIGTLAIVGTLSTAYAIRTGNRRLRFHASFGGSPM